MRKILIFVCVICVTLAFGSLAMAKVHPNKPHKFEALCAPCLGLTTGAGVEVPCIYPITLHDIPYISVNWHWEECDQDPECIYDPSIAKFSVEICGDDPCDDGDARLSYDFGTGDDGLLFLSLSDGISFSLLIPVETMESLFCVDCTPDDGVDNPVCADETSIKAKVKALRPGKDYRQKNNWSQDCYLVPLPQ